MKKLVSVFLSIILALSVCILPASAAGSGSISGSATVTAGNNSDYTVSISGCADATSVSVNVSVGDNLSVVSGTWLKSGSLTNFDPAKNKGALGGLSSPDINGNLFKLTVNGAAPSATGQSISITVSAKNGSTEIFNQTFNKSVTVGCSTHQYSGWSKLNDSQHTRTCSACGHKETENHKWNSGTVKKAANCKESGTKEYTCTVCGATKTETIPKTTSHSWGAYKTTKEPTCTEAGVETATCTVCGATTTKKIPATGHSYGAWQVTKEATCTEDGVETRACSKCPHTETRKISALGHKFSDPVVTKEPTCTEPGEQTGTCSRCGKTTVQKIKALGHKFGKWEEVTPATCTKGGTKKRVCSACGEEEERKTKALGHDFENPTVVKEATIYSTGLMEGKCKHCGETTQQTIPCGCTDGNTGIALETEKGVFGKGAELSVETVDQQSAVYTNTKNILSDVASSFTLYNIEATLNGEKTTPNGKVTVTFPIPENYGNEVEVYLIGEDGTSQKAEAVTSEDGRTATVETDKLGLFSVCKLGKETQPEESDPATSQSDTDADGDNRTLDRMLLYVIAAAVFVTVIVVIVIVAVKKKKV